MSYTALFFLITLGCLSGAPIFRESLQFRVLECIPGDNDTLSSHVVEITNINETCVRVNVTTSSGQEAYLYVIPETEIGVKVQIKTENCSTPLPDIHFSLCDEPSNSNDTGMMVIFEYKNATLPEIIVQENNSTMQPILYTGPTVYETLHRIYQEKGDEDQTTNNTPSASSDDDATTTTPLL